MDLEVHIQTVVDIRLIQYEPEVFTTSFKIGQYPTAQTLKRTEHKRNLIYPKWIVWIKVIKIIFILIWNQSDYGGC